MKYAKPILFKRAVKKLVEYIESYNGIYAIDEWRKEVAAITKHVAPEDYKKFENISNKLEIIGTNMNDVWLIFESKLCSMDNTIKKLVKKL